MTPREFHTELPETLQTPVTEADAEAARLVTERLDEITTRANRARRRVRTACLAAVCSILSIFVLSALGVALQDPRLFMLGGCFVVLALAATLVMVGFIIWGSPKFDVDEIARMGGVRAIVPLFSALQNTAPAKQRQAIHSALVLLLPQMKASDANLLTPFARLTINSWLRDINEWNPERSRFDDLCIATLKALEQVGDASAIPSVERLATKRMYTQAGREVQQAALECLPMLRANCGEVEIARTLLRASQSEDVRPDTLLRPASNSGQTGSAELLRGADSPDAAE